MTRLTMKKVNAAIKAAGGGSVELVKGDGYFYFAGGESEEWNSTGVYVYTLNELTLERWVEEWTFRRDAYLADK
jgi:exopolyphosphatase/pppGpp-phosphohydrolase